MRKCCSLYLQDICKPDAIRLRRNLSAVINFAKFREEKLVPYAEMQEQTIALLEETEALEETNKDLVSDEHHNQNVWKDWQNAQCNCTE